MIDSNFGILELMVLEYSNAQNSDKITAVVMPSCLTPNTPMRFLKYYNNYNSGLQLFANTQDMIPSESDK